MLRRADRIMENLNITENGTQASAGCSMPNYHTIEKIGKCVAYCLILAVSLAGNSLVVIIICKTKTMRTTTNYFILNMAISDLLQPILVFPSKIIEMYGRFWFFSGEQGQTFCKVVLLIQYVSCLVSIENLVLIAVDRFGAVVFPFRRPLFGSKLCPFFILTTWVAAIALSSSTFYKAVEYTGKFSCEWVWQYTFVADNYIRAVPFVFMAVSFALIVILYSLILFKLKSQKTPGEQSVNIVTQRERRQRNVLRMAVAIVTGFVVCWGPSNIIALLTVFVWNNAQRMSCEIANYWVIALFMAYANCAINPFICFTFSGKYRQGLKVLFRCHKKPSREVIATTTE